MKKIMLLIVMVLTGCASGTHIITGIQRPKIKPEQVVLYQIPPAKFEIIGIVNARGPGTTQHNMNQAVNELKQEAADIGANGIILGSVNPGSESVGFSSGTAFGGGTTFGATGVGFSGTGVQISGQAIYVTTTNMTAP
jgi:hypothetical protein